MTNKDVDALHGKLAALNRVGLAHLPTPLQCLERLSAHLDGPTIWIKRDDLTGLGMGGNKLRKLDYVLREAIDAGCDTIVSGGVVQSNSQRQVAAASAKLGLACHLAVYHGRVPPPSPEYESSGNAFLNRIFGATLHDVPWTGDRNAAIEQLCEQLANGGKKAFIVPYGVSNGLGAAGYASAALEISTQYREVDIVPSAIVHCTGSGGTQAGLAIGVAACLPHTKVVGIDIDAEPARVKADVIKHASAAAALLDIDFTETSIEVVAGLSGPGYGIPHAKTISAIHLMGRLEGLIVDPVYSGKGLAGLISLIQAGRWSRDEHVVFVHTGGEPAVFAYRTTINL
ncbi:MAG: D-cysteine desulfhydrase family protein [Pseudomonadota bacterium]